MTHSATEAGGSSRAQWKTRSGFILAALGSAIGLGNIWRFSYLCYEHGGGAFLIPYTVALVTAGIPLLILEFGVGHRMRGAAAAAFAKINPRWEWLGWWAVIFVMFGIVLYYSVVIAWCMSYLGYAFTMRWGSDPNAFFFQQFLQVSSTPGALGTIRTPIFISLLIVWGLNWVVVFGGIQRGIERANKVFIPLLIGLTAVLVVWALQLPGADEGLRQYLTPDFSALGNWKIWGDAYSQIFFTLSLGFGIMIAYASYLPKRADIVRYATIVSVGNCGYSLFAGLAVFGTLGYMAQATGVPISEVVQQSVGLAFVVYPQAISLLPAGGELFGVIFFTTLVVAGLSSSVSIIEAFTAAFIDKYGVSRRIVVSVLAVAGLMGSMVFATNAGLLWLDLVDHFLTHYGLVLVGILQCVLIGWVYRASKLRDHINQLAGWHLGAWWDVSICFVIPLVLGTILVFDVVRELGAPYGGYSWPVVLFIGWGWLLATLIAAVLVAMRPWHRSRM